MCFSIPYKVLSIKDTTVFLENGKRVYCEPEMELQVGQYVRTQGSLIVSILSEEEGKEVQRLIGSLNRDIL